jgi:superoxide reductase
MANPLEIYKCDACGNIVEVFQAGPGELACCGSPMVLLAENTVEAATEKHVPVIEKSAAAVTVKVGSLAHPMEEKHFIQWIELIADNKVYRQELKPGNKPEATFEITADKVVARGYCNLHGHWKTEA